MEVGECETDKITVDLQLAVLIFFPGKDNSRRSV